MRAWLLLLAILTKALNVTADPIVTYTLWLVIVGSLQFVALIIQAAFLYRAFRETTIATQLTAQALVEAQRSNAANEALTAESNENAKMSSNAAKASADALVNAERAWMILGGFQQVNEPWAANSTILFKFKNSGRTRRWITEFSFRLVISPVEITAPINYEELSDGPWVDPRPIEQGASTLDFTAVFQHPPTSPDRERFLGIINGSLFLYFLGILKYRDIFGSLCETRFCYRNAGAAWVMSGPDDANTHI